MSNADTVRVKEKKKKKKKKLQDDEEQEEVGKQEQNQKCYTLKYIKAI